MAALELSLTVPVTELVAGSRRQARVGEIVDGAETTVVAVRTATAELEWPMLRRFDGLPVRALAAPESTAAPTVEREDARCLRRMQGRELGGVPLQRMSESLPICPECSSEHTSEMGALLVCPMCAHEWAADEAAADAVESGPRVITDAVGNVLADGDTVTVIKDLKVKGSSTVIKVGTKVRGIRLIDGVGDHDIDCKVDGVGPTQLKSSVVKKA